MIFPEFHNIDEINYIREKYDPLVHNVRPHITLVFPFASDFTADELNTHILETLASIKPFKLQLQRINGQMEDYWNYIFLGVQEGKNEIIDLHKRLYTGILEQFYPKFLKGKGYSPHMTVGKIQNKDEFHHALKELAEFKEPFETTIQYISVEIIDDNEDSMIEMHVKLSGT